jgi:predicted dehydrogenase
MDSISVGVIGTGAMGKNHIRIYNELKSVNSVYIYDVNEKSMHNIEDFYNGWGDVYACDYLKSIADTCDAVSICVPTQYHKSTIENLIKNGYESHILIEKPLCAHSKEALDLVKILSETNKNLVYGVGHVERFNPIIPELNKIIEDPLYVEFKRHNPSSSRMVNTDVIEDLMIHDIDIMRYLFGAGISSIYGKGNHDIFSATITIGNMPIHLSASRKSSKKIRSIYIEMEEFTIDADYMSQEITIYSKPDRYKFDNEKYTQENVVEKVMVTKKEPLKEELKTFIDCAFYNQSFPVSTDDAINAMLICEDLKSQIR